MAYWLAFLVSISKTTWILDLIILYGYIGSLTLWCTFRLIAPIDIELLWGNTEGILNTMDNVSV